MPGRRKVLCRGAWKEQGFTLLELLVVLAIMAGLLTVIPSVMAGLPLFRLRAGAAGLAEVLRRARDDAVRTGRTTNIAVDAQHRRYMVPEQPVVSLSDAADSVEARSANPVRGAEAGSFRFFADGSASGGAVDLRRGARHILITVDWLTGRVRVED